MGDTFGPMASASKANLKKMKYRDMGFGHFQMGRNREDYLKMVNI